MIDINNLALRYKLAIAPLACLLALAGVAAAGLWGFAHLASGLESLYAERLPSYTYSSRLESDVRDLNGLINQSIALASVGYGDDDIRKIDNALTKLASEVEAGLKAKVADPKLKAEELGDLEAIAASFAKYNGSLRETLRMKATALVSAATFFGTAQADYVKLLNRISTVSQRKLDEAGSDVARARRGAEEAKLMILVSTAAAVVVAVCAVIWITRGLLLRVGRLSESARRLAGGDLNQPVAIEGADEIGHLMGDVETVRRQLAESLGTVRQATESLRIAATEIAAGNTDLGHRTERTSSSLQETVSSLRQLTAAVDENVRISEEAASRSADAATAARQGGDLMNQAVSTMEDINQASKRIAEVTAVIDRIAAQTNILALNAAVESARAGEQGRGFAIVAGEVRMLAKQSREAAQEIAELIKTSGGCVQTGRRLVEGAGESVGALVTRVADVAQLVSDIRRATAAQSGEIVRINQALAAVDNSTQQNAGLVEQSSAAAESLRSQADNLSQAVSRFNVSEASVG